MIAEATAEGKRCLAVQAMPGYQEWLGVMATVRCNDKYIDLVHCTCRIIDNIDTGTVGTVPKPSLQKKTFSGRGARDLHQTGPLRPSELFCNLQ